MRKQLYLCLFILSSFLNVTYARISHDFYSESIILKNDSVHGSSTRLRIFNQKDQRNWSPYIYVGADLYSDQYSKAWQENSFYSIGPGLKYIINSKWSVFTETRIRHYIDSKNQKQNQLDLRALLVNSDLTFFTETSFGRTFIERYNETIVSSYRSVNQATFFGYYRFGIRQEQPFSLSSDLFLESAIGVDAKGFSYLNRVNGSLTARLTKTSGIFSGSLGISGVWTRFLALPHVKSVLKNNNKIDQRILFVLGALI